MTISTGKSKSRVEDEILHNKLSLAREEIKNELDRVQSNQNLDASPQTIRSEMGFVQLLQLAN